KKTEDMKAYSKSILEYDDVISSLRFVEERAREETKKEERIEFVRNCHKYNMDIEPCYPRSRRLHQTVMTP
ncbi:MAG: hypothetical protein LBM08_15835, partial [Dysgonamonadaceae bacterium]|nr:hypothetical protein [Dysgonamonadaceae bacterium]